MDAQYPEDDVELAEWLVAEWDEGRGTSKSQLERFVWDDGASHGRKFDRFVRQTLGIETARSSKQTDRIAELEDQVRSLGGRPFGTPPKPWEEQLQHARVAALAALRIWNDPIVTFRTGLFSLGLVTAWNSLAIAVLQKAGREWRQLDGAGQPTLLDDLEKSKNTSELVGDAFDAPENRGLNLKTRITRTAPSRAAWQAYAWLLERRLTAPERQYSRSTRQRPGHRGHDRNRPRWVCVLSPLRRVGWSVFRVSRGHYARGREADVGIVGSD